MQNIPYSNQNQNYNQNNYQNQNPTQYIITKDIIYKASKIECTFQMVTRLFEK